MEIPTPSGVPDTPVRDNTGILMMCVCCLVSPGGGRDRCIGVTNIDQPFCDSCEKAGHNDPNVVGTNFAPVAMEVLQEERRQAINKAQNR